MNTPFLETSFLVTESDFINMSLTKKQYLTPKENKIILRVLGFIAVLCGVAAYAFMRNSAYQIICWILLILIGLFALFYYDVISPSMVRKNAKAFYNFNKSALTSKTVRFYDNAFEIYSDNYRVSVPKKYIYKIVESKNTVMIFFDKNEYCFIPIRVFSDEQLERLHEFALSDKEKYKKV